MIGSMAGKSMAMMPAVMMTKAGKTKATLTAIKVTKA
jgi:hypothetical protein